MYDNVLGRYYAFILNNGAIPKIDTKVYVASTAVVVGDVTIGTRANIWFNAIIQGLVLTQIYRIIVQFIQIITTQLP